MENMILMNSDGTFPVSHDGNILVGGRLGRSQHKFIKGGSALPKLMNNLSLFDSSVMKGRGVSQPKPNFGPGRKPIKFII